ncbi:MAG TPA: hypothetical protein VLI54_00005 [Bacillota bacterium]|nr:hypothetical protein [Bacillota bacterium]
MKKSESSQDKINSLNKKVHDLNYVELGKASKVSVSPDRERGRALAEKIRANIEAYQNEITAPRRPSIQSL